MANKEINPSSQQELQKQLEVLQLQNQQLKIELSEVRHQLEEQSNVFENVVENCVAGYWDWHITQDYEYLSGGFKKMIGYLDHELPNHPSTWQKIIHPEDLPYVMTKYDQHVQSKGKIPFDAEVRYYHKNGYILDFYCRGKVISWDENGAPLRMVGVYIDISQLKQAERAITATNQEYEALHEAQLLLENELRDAIEYQQDIILQLEENQRKLKEVQQLTGVGHFITYFKPRHTVWSPEIYAQFGLSPQEDPPVGEDYYKFMHPEDVIIAKKAIRQALRGEEVTFEQRILRPDGKMAYIKATIKPRRNEEGKIIGIYGGSVDLTNIKKVQEENTRSEILQRAVFNSSLDALFVINTQNDRIIECNDRAVLLLEFNSKEEIIGRSGKSLLTKAFSIEKIDKIQQEISSIGSWSSEMQYSTDKGKCFWGNLAFTSIDTGAEKMMLIRITDITERIKLRGLLTETQKMAKIGGWEYDMQTRQVTWTDEMYHIYGLPVGTVITMEEAMAYCAPEYQESVMKGLNNLIKEGGTYQFEAELVNADSKKIWIRVIATAHRENNWTVKLSGTFQNIDLSKRQEILLRSKQNELRAFVEAAPAAIAMFDRNMHYIAASEKWYEDYQLLDQRILGKSHYEIFPELSEEWKEIHQQCLHGAIANKEEDKFVRANGAIHWEKWEIRPWYDSIGEIGGIIMFTEDITDRKFQEAELLAATKKAEEASLAKAQFLSTMSHEIRTPMNAVIGMTHILLQEDPKPDQVENLQALRFSAENLLALINDILDFSKIEAGKVELEQADFSIRDLVYGIKKSLAYNAEEKGLKLKILLDEDIPEVVVGDPTRLTQILVNLLSNAIKFTEKGSVTLTVEVAHRDKNNARLHFGVKDTGIGIPEDKMERIFESFSQADTHTTRKYGGTGLGLAITKSLLELFDSQIHLESKTGQGAHFYFEINFVVNHKRTYHSLNFESTQPSFDSLKGYKVLLVEDNPMNVLVAKRFLNKWELDFDHAENGKIAIQLAFQNDYDLILMDLQMPEKDGFEATQEIKSFGKQIPIIALTASVMLETQEKIFTVGMDDFVTKPFNPNELYQKISKHLSKNKISASS